MESAVGARLQQQVIRSITASQARSYPQFFARTNVVHLAHVFRRSRKPIATSSRNVPLQSIRNASSSSSSSKKPSQPPKHTILEQPDTFRPPSHGSRLRSKSRSTTASYGSYGSPDGQYSYAGGYNQGSSQSEREQQSKRSYPNMFPNEGSFMHWFLTNRSVHLWISLGTLSLLAVITLTQTFVKTSPFAHLLPPLSHMIFHPISFIRESASAVRLHIDYNSEKTAEKRRQNIMDAQKRRLYRRAHGMEDLDKEGEGVDVKGLVEWDDGMSSKERERLREKQKKQQQLGEGGVATLDLTGDDQQQQVQPPPPPRKKVKKWLGIWE